MEDLGHDIGYATGEVPCRQGRDGDDTGQASQVQDSGNEEMTGWMTEHGIIKQGCTIVEVFRACCHQYGVYHSREGARFLPNILACILQCILTCFNDTSTIISYRQRCIQIGDVFYQVSSAVFCSDSCNDNAVYVARVSILTILVCIIRFTL